MGKALLAYLPDDQVEALIEAQGMKAYTSNTIVSLKQLKKELSAVCKNGFAVSNAEHVLGLYAVAAMVRGESGPVASLGLLGRDLESILATSDKVCQIAEAISHRIDRSDG